MDVLQILIAGIAKGCVYGLLALGFVLIYKATEQVNFAQGDIMMMGTFFAFTFITGFTSPVIWWQLPAAIALAAVSAFLFLVVVKRRLPRAIEHAKESKEGREGLLRMASTLTLVVSLLLGLLAGILLLRFLGGFGMPWIFGLIAAGICGAVFGYALDAVLVRRILGQPAFAVIILTIAIGFALRWAAGVVWGHTSVGFNVPYANIRWSIGGEAEGVRALVINATDVVIIAGTVLMIVLLYLFFRFTRIGVAMQAASQNQLAAYYMGIPVKYVFSLIWAISAGTAAIAGVLLVPKLQVFDPNLGFLAIPAFAAAVIGGFGSLPGALLGGVIVGITEQMTAAFLPAGLASWLPQISGFLLMLVILVIRPEGLFAQVQRKKV